MNSLSRLKTLGMYKTNIPEKERNKYGKSFFNSEKEMVCSEDSKQKFYQDIVTDSITFHLDTKHENDFLPANTAVWLKL